MLYDMRVKGKKMHNIPKQALQASTYQLELEWYLNMSQQSCSS